MTSEEIAKLTEEYEKKNGPIETIPVSFVGYDEWGRSHTTQKMVNDIYLRWKRVNENK